MIEQLFGSKTRVKLLKLFFSNPNRSFYVREITRIVDEQINSVRRELANLLSLGLITSDSSNNKLYYEVDQKYEYFSELQSMFSEIASEQDTAGVADKAGVKSPETEPTAKSDKSDSSDKDTETENDAGAEQTAKKKLKTTAKTNDVVELPEAGHWVKAGNISGIAYSGVYTRDETSGVDILVIGDVVASKIESVVAKLEKEKNKELRYTVIEVDEWNYRKQVHDKFWLQFTGSKIQIVLDKDKLFSKK